MSRQSYCSHRLTSSDRKVNVGLQSNLRSFQTHHLLRLQLDKRVDLIVVEHITRGQKGTILIEAFKRFPQAGTDGRYRPQFLRWQVVKILIHGLARMDLVPDAVEPC